jgi:hypothetical protein
MPNLNQARNMIQDGTWSTTTVATRGAQASVTFAQAWVSTPRVAATVNSNALFAAICFSQSSTGFTGLITNLDNATSSTTQNATYVCGAPVL